MTAAHDTQALAEFLTLWAHESRLQTFENRERFRKEATALASRLQEQEGQPVLSDGWSGWACQYPGRLPRLYGARHIAEVNLDEENGDRLMFVKEVSHD